MNKISELFDYMRQCPQLADLWGIGATEDAGIKVILPQGASQSVQYQEKIDVYGNYSCEIVPYPSVYEDYQINCYTMFDTNDNSVSETNINIINFDDVQAICDWIAQQNDNGNLPYITGKKVISIECNPFVPQIRYVNTAENIIAYFITVRVRYLNTAKRRCVEFAVEN